MGDGRAGESPAMGNRGQAAISLTPDTDDKGFGSSLDSIPSTFLENRSSDAWIAVFFLASYLTS